METSLWRLQQPDRSHRTLLFYTFALPPMGHHSAPWVNSGEPRTSMPQTSKASGNLQEPVSVRAETWTFTTHPPDLFFSQGTVAESVESGPRIHEIKSSVPSRLKSMTYKTDTHRFLAWWLTLLG